jgi:UDP-glucose 4-epimerase
LADEFTVMSRANKVKKPNFHQNFARSSQSMSSSVIAEEQNTVLHNATNPKIDASLERRKNYTVRESSEALFLLQQLNAPTVRNLGIVFNSVTN